MGCYAEIYVSARVNGSEILQQGAERSQLGGLTVPFMQLIDAIKNLLRVVLMNEMDGGIGDFYLASGGGPAKPKLETCGSVLGVAEYIAFEITNDGHHKLGK